MASTFSVLSEPTRRGILDLLREQPHSVGELVELLGLTQPGTSKHLRVLREAGLVSVRRQAQRRMYELRPAPLAEIDLWLAPYRQLWSDRFDALERHLDTMADAPPTQPPSEPAAQPRSEPVAQPRSEPAMQPPSEPVAQPNGERVAQP